LIPKTFTSTLAAAVTSVAFQLKLRTWQSVPWVHEFAAVTETSVPARTSEPLSQSSIRAVGVPLPQVASLRNDARNSWRLAPLVRDCVGVAKLK
jgi:hypothetical protein